VDQFPALGFLYITLKIFVGLCLMIWLRATLPRLRYDQLMDLGWKRLLPLAVINLIVTAVVVIVLDLI
jgi:NADH-quinone oxidoreductase subunit H